MFRSVVRKEGRKVRTVRGLKTFFAFFEIPELVDDLFHYTLELAHLCLECGEGFLVRDRAVCL